MKPNKNQITQHVRGYSRNGITSRAKLFLFLGSLAFLFFGTLNAKAQETPETIYKDWHFVGESKSHVDISAKITKCTTDSPNQIHLFVFNEGSENNDVKFTIKVSEIEGSKSFSVDVRHKVERAEMIRAECGNKLDNLKINLPADYNPNNILITVTF